ncbi:hypothetical protein ACIQNU_04850 [Streptomyces sp. NPDC091292]|uniref:hypothetical protein n=1 Tax=Streptomyces sp. NPDC091292 TaxID=3365991 RepID=UPI00381951E5
MKRTLHLAAAGACLAVLAGCSLPQGPPGVVIDKSRAYQCTGVRKNRTCTWSMHLTVRQEDGSTRRFRVSIPDYTHCVRGARYPTCTNG